MTGPEHYREAERLRDEAKDFNPGSDWETSLHAAARVHATLAHAAAVIDQHRHADSAITKAWLEVTG